MRRTLSKLVVVVVVVAVMMTVGADALGDQQPVDRTVQRHKRSDDVSVLQTTVDGLSQQLSAFVARLAALENRMSSAEVNVAFHAFHESDPFSLASHGTIVYDSVTTNIGNAYNPLNGFFTAPAPGTYMFFINCMAVHGTAEEPSIMVQGTPRAACYSNMVSSGTSEQGATFTVVQLQAGDQVWVRIRENAENTRGYFWNTFAGFLLKAE